MNKKTNRTAPMEFKNYYEILGVPSTADDKAIKQAYRQLVRKHHPDVNPGNKAAEEQCKVTAQAQCPAIAF